MLKVSLHILRNELFGAAPELDPLIVFGAKGPVVLLDALATTAPIQMEVNNCSNEQMLSQFRH